MTNPPRKNEEKKGNYQSSLNGRGGGYPPIGKRPIYFRVFLLKASLKGPVKKYLPIEFVCFLETYLRKFIHFDHGGTPEDPFSPRVPKISLTEFILGSLWASMKAKWNYFEMLWKVNIKMSQFSAENATSLMLLSAFKPE